MSLLGLQKNTVYLCPYSDEWPIIFRSLQEELNEALGEWLLSVEHIGSTAIPGMKAKPIIDIMAGVKTLALPKEFFTKLASIEFDHRPLDNVSDREFFGRNHNDLRVHNLAVCVFGESHWRDRIAFRDSLRRNPRLAEEYRKLKIDLAEHHFDDRGQYTEGKSLFVEKVLTEQR